MAELITTDQIQYWMKTDADFVRVTETNAFDPATDLTTYDPTYKDRVNQPSYVTGKKTTIEMDIDLIAPGDLQEWLLANEDEVNVPTEIVRVLMFKAATAPATGYVAKKAAFSLTQNPIDGSAGEAAKATGTLKMTSDGWTEGTFDPATATFTPAA
jgi:hypothetical protein